MNIIIKDTLKFLKGVFLFVRFLETHKNENFFFLS